MIGRKLNIADEKATSKENSTHAETKQFSPEERKKIKEKFRGAVKHAMYINRWLVFSAPHHRPTTQEAKQANLIPAHVPMKVSYSGGLNANGVYKTTLNSSSSIGVFKSTGTTIIAKLDNGDYELKACLDPNIPEKAPCYAIDQKYYFHAIGKEGNDKKTFLCSGKVYVQKTISRFLPMITKIVEAENVEVSFGEEPGSTNNTYQFTQNPITLFGVSPGKMVNTGQLTKTSNEPTDAEVEQAWREKNLDEALKLPGLSP